MTKLVDTAFSGKLFWRPEFSDDVFASVHSLQHLFTAVPGPLKTTTLS